MATYRVWSGSGVTQFIVNTAYSQGNRIVPALADAGTNYLVARKYVWECTTAGTSDAALNPTWPASVTPDVTTVTSNTATFTARNIGYATGTTVNWNFATPLFLYAVGAAGSDGDLLFVHKTHSEELTTDTTYAFTNSVAVLCVDKDANEALSTQGVSYWIGNSTTSYAITVTCGSGKYLYTYGVTLRTSGSSVKDISVQQASAATCRPITLESCYLWINSNISSVIYLGSKTANINGVVRANNCTFRFGNTLQKVVFGNGVVELNGGEISTAGSVPVTGCFSCAGGSNGAYLISGMDLSFVGGNYLVDYTAIPVSTFTFINCKLGSTVILSEPMSSHHAEVFGYNCSSNDQHYQFYHENFLGKTLSSTEIKAIDGASYDGTQRYSWKIVTSSAASFYAPYISPWFGTYHNGTDPISPSVEVLRNGSSTPLTDADVWPEFSTQETYSSTLATIRSGRMTLLGTAKSQPTGIGIYNWQGWSGSAWSGKLSCPAKVRPQAPGDLKARICVGAASTTLYVDPQVRT